MARGNKFERYLNDNDTSSSSSILKKTANATGKVLKTAALLGGGYYGLKALKNNSTTRKVLSETAENLGSAVNRTFDSPALASGLKNASQKIDYVDAYMTGLNKTIKDSGYTRFLSGRAQEDFKTNLEKEFLRVQRGETRSVGGTDTFIEKAMDKLSADKARIGKEVISSVRRENVLRDIGLKFKDKDNGDFISQVLGNVIRKESHKDEFMDYLKGGSEGIDQVKRVLRKYNVHNDLSELDFQKAAGSLHSTLMDHSMAGAKRKAEYVKDNKDVITQRIKAINKEYNQALIKRSKKPTASTKVAEAMGLKRVTVGEAIKEGILDSAIAHDKKYFYTRNKAGQRTLDNMELDASQILKNVFDDIPGLEDAYVDPLVFKNRSGNIVDLRSFGTIPKKSMTALGNNFQVPFVNIRPFEMINNITGLNKANRKTRAIFRSGSIMPTISNTNDPLKNTNLFFYGRVIDDTGKMVKDNQFVTSSTRGIFGRIHRAQSGLSIRPEALRKPESAKDYIKKFFGFGYQDHQSALSKRFSFFTKFGNDQWGRNIYNDIVNKTSTAYLADTNLNTAFKKFFSTIESNTRSMDRDTLEIFFKEFDTTLDDETVSKLIHGNKEDGVVEAMGKLLDLNNTSDDVTLAYENEIKGLLDSFVRDPGSMDSPYRFFKHRQDIAAPEILEAITSNPTDVMTMMDHAEKILHAELINQAELKSIMDGERLTVGKLVSRLGRSQATGDQVQTIRNLNLHKEFKKLAGRSYTADDFLSEESLKGFSQMLTEPNLEKKKLRDDLERIIYKANPTMGYGPGERFVNPFEGNQDIVLGETHPIESINKIIKEGGGVYDIFKAAGNTLGFGKDRVGRGNMANTSTASSAAYFYLFRLNEGISKLGLGLSSKDMGSTQDIAKNLFLKRMLAPLAAISAVSYVNDEVGNITGERPTQGLARSYANITVGVQTIKEVTGLNAFGRYLERQFPGSDKLKENPLGIAAKFGTFGAIGENRTPGEMREYYTSGVDEVRRGRFWSIGSSTPIYGDRIKYYQPNLYRRIQADPMMTDVMYGSTSEYWANHWLPNPRNPLGALNPFTWGHWERKHYEDRPYPTSSSGLEAVPIVGPALDGTIGRIIKPFRRRPGLEKAHREYLEDINEKYKYYASMESQGGYIYMSAGGRMTPSQVQGGQAGGQPIGTSTSGMGAPGSYVPTKDGAVRVIDPTGGFAPVQRGAAISQAEVTAINQGYVAKANIKPSYNSMSIDSLRDNIYVENLDEAMDPNSAAYRLGATYYSATEMGGIYGFATTLLFGEGNPNRPVLESSSKMTGLNRTFWDMELGGFGGELSEIYRRFLPRHRRMREYNPFKNTMPDWLPGVEYFQDFKHGDPYSKIPKGELRLPGAGYESLNRLHPDVFGRYGAIDRYKILADVAPYSEQYRYYSSVVSRMHNAGMISDSDYKQIKQVRELVSKQKEKYDFHPYRFKYADIEKQEVTVLRWIDKDTFITKEHPGNPIRLAAISMPSQGDESSVANRAREILREAIVPGEKVTIGVDADPLNRTRDDTMNTMRAVVYNKWGESVNKLLADLSPMFSGLTGEESPVEADWDDHAATSTHALYTDKQIKIGKLWEKFSHLDTPFHTKFLQVRSPLEMYKRKELYGKNWQSWRHPIRDWVVPTVEKMVERNPLSASLHGATAGFLIGTFTRSKAVGAAVGALVGGLGASARTVGELTKNSLTLGQSSTWIPKRRREERAINEYFDKLKYVKYRGLYEKTRRLAMEREGIDPEDIAKRAANKNKGTSYLRQTLDEAKKWLKINKSHPFSDEEEIDSKLRAVNEELNYLDENREIMRVGPLTQKALMYKEQYETTLYGADPYGDLMKIYRAMPKKDRPFFKEFMLAPPEEREEILRLVPDDQKRFYQAKWGLDVDRKGSLTEFFATHKLPGPNWEGWKPDYNMEEIKLKFVQNEGLEIGEFGFWDDDLRYVKDAPKIRRINNGGLIDIAQLKEVLKGAGLDNADVEVETQTFDEEPDSFVGIDIMMRHDRRNEVKETINNNIYDILG